MIRFLATLLLIKSLAFSQYFSQSGQDRFVNETFFKNFQHGVFVDIGAHDGVTYNNTYFFEKELNWTGICLEPNLEVFTKLKNNRECHCICGCASSDHGVVKDFLKISGPLEMLSGLIDKFDDQHRTRIECQLKEFGGFYEVIKVKCYNLNRLLRNAGIKHIHFLSLDTEGGEYEILQHFDFTKCRIDVIAVEDNYRIHPFIDLMNSRGFKLVQVLEQDLIFVSDNPSWAQPAD